MDVIDKIVSATGMSKEEIEQKILDKQRELSNLISREGAAYIVAKELGLDLVKPKQKIEIRNLVPGIRNLTLEARILHVFEPREFERDGKHKVASLILSDGSGRVRLSVWDEQVELIKNLEPGMALQISGAYTREDQRGVELRLSRSGNLKVIEKSDLPTVEEIKRKGAEPVRTALVEVREGDNIETRATLVQLFEVEQLFEICPQCGSRLKKEKIQIKPGIEAYAWKCAKHGNVEPKLSLVVSGVLDDGTANLRAVFFRENALKLLGLTSEELLSKKGKIFEHVDLLGKEFIVCGRIRRNKIFGRLELIVSDICSVDIEKEIDSLLNALGSNT